MDNLDLNKTADLSKFLKHFPIDGGLTLQILKGHLLLEELIREIFTMQLIKPSALNGGKGTSFDCHQVICLVEAMTPAAHIAPWIWISTKKLNKIRNDLAHKLTPVGLKDKVADLIKYVKRYAPEIDEIKNSKGNDLFLVIISICAGLSGLKSALQENFIKKAKA